MIYDGIIYFYIEASVKMMDLKYRIHGKKVKIVSKEENRSGPGKKSGPKEFAIICSFKRGRIIGVANIWDKVAKL